MPLSAGIHPGALPVAPGELARAELRVINSGGAPRNVRLEVAGETATWVWTNPVDLEVPAGGEVSARIMVRPPRGSDPPAGPLPVTVRVVPTRGGDTPAEAVLTVDVAPLHELSAALEPRSARDRRGASYALTVDNRGNAPVRVALRPEAEPGLHVAADPGSLEVERGATGHATVRARARRPLLRGPRRREFRVEVTAEGGAAATASAAFEQDASLPWWASWTAAALVAVLLGSVAVQALSPTADPTDLVSGAPNPGGPSPRARDSAVAPDVDASCPVRDHVDPGAGIRFLDEREREPRDRDAQPPRSYSFLAAARDGCQPVRFNPCEPVRYVIGGDPPAGAANEAHEAVARVSEASGLRFVFEGETDESFGRRSPYQPDRYGERWPPLLIAFEHQGTRAPRDGGEGSVVAGTGVPTAVGDVLVTAQMSLNVDAIVDLDTRETVPGGFGPGITRGRILLHELGHSIGLGHVADAEQIMHEPLTDHPPVPADYADGDRVGLRFVGAELGCLDTPPVPDQALPAPPGHATPSPAG